MSDHYSVVAELKSAAKWFSQHGRNTNTAIIGICERAVYLIRRQQVEIDVLKTNCLSMAQSMPNIAKAERAEAIKEFAERLKENKIDIDVSFGYGREVYTEAVAVIEIDNLVKEMVGDVE